MTNVTEQLRRRVLAAREHLKDGRGVFVALRLSRIPPIKGGVGADFINDLKNNLVYSGTLGNSIVPQVATSTVTGTGVDLSAADGPIFAFVHVGTVSGTTPTLDVALQESNTLAGTYAALPVAATLPTITASNAFGIINGKRTKRFIRAVATIGGATPSVAFAVSVVGQRSPL